MIRSYRVFTTATAVTACLLAGGLRVADAGQVERVRGQVEKVDSHTGAKTTVTMVDRVTTTKGEPKIDKARIDKTVDKPVDRAKGSGRPDSNGKKAISGVLNGTEKTANQSRPKQKS